MSGRSDHLIGRARWIAGTAGLVVLPFVVMTVFLRWSRLNVVSSSVLMDFGGMLLAVLSGVAGIWLFPLAWKPKLIAAVGYSPMMAGVLYLYGLFYVCAALGRCL